MVWVYGLCDPRDGTLRYVGKSANPHHRFQNHLCPGKADYTHKACWIRGLRNLGFRPTLELLERVSSDDADDVERFWIASLRAAGASLTNLSNGGDGVDHTTEVRAKIVKANKQRKGEKRPPETGRRISAALLREHPMRGKHHSPETRRKMSESHKSIVITPEWRAKMLAGMSHGN